MEPSIKQQWLAELRSGKHAQGRAALKAEDGSLCCMGVLEHVVMDVEYHFEPDNSLYVSEGGCGRIPMKESLQAAQLNRASMCELMNMNDNGSSFSQIADWIEEHL